MLCFLVLIAGVSNNSVLQRWTLKHSRYGKECMLTLGQMRTSIGFVYACSCWMAVLAAAAKLACMSFGL
jgi:hypothetical protein